MYFVKVLEAGVRILPLLLQVKRLSSSAGTGDYAPAVACDFSAGNQHHQSAPFYYQLEIQHLDTIIAQINMYTYTELLQ